MNKIKILSKDLINKIAAGEVVERPASIVKELIENSIDSNATEITLSLENSGLDSITVSDNGIGMNMEDAKMAVRQHATSKIENEQDLYNINTLGFRGEALASIGSISELIIHTYDGVSEPVSVSLINGDEMVKVGKGRVRGTTISSSRIFANVPARRKFLKSENTEYKYILDTFINLALTRKDIRFKLIKNGKVQLELLKTDNIINRIKDINPNMNTNDLIEINYNEPGIIIYGYVLKPDKISSNNPKQYLFLNNRFIISPLVNKAIREGYATSLMHGYKPSYFMYLELDTSKFDVNVHPRKLEVRFDDTNKIFSTIKRIVEYNIKKVMQDELKSRFSNKNLSPSIDQKYERIKKVSYKDKGQEFLDFKSPKSGIKASIEFTKDILEDVSSIEINRPILKEEYNSGINIQIFNTYIITVREDKVIFLDQHAADERVNFEKISKGFQSNDHLSSQDLLIPEQIKLAVNDMVSIRNNIKLFERIGFKIDHIKENSLDIITIPLILKNKKIKDTFIKILEDISSSSGSIWEKIKDKLIATLACHSSIRAGQKLDQMEINKLIEDLFKCDLPNSCPHGRPIVFEISKFELEKKLKRRV